MYVSSNLINTSNNNQRKENDTECQTAIKEIAVDLI